MKSTGLNPFAFTVRLAYMTLVTPRSLPPILWGAPGSAKTSVVGQMAASLGMPMETIIASVCDPTDFGGYPIPDGETLKRLPMQWASNLLRKGKGIAFIDEISTCPPATQAALLRCVLDGAVGDLQLPRYGDAEDDSGVRWMAAANPPEQAAGGHELTDPLQNRFVHIEWPSPDAAAWCEYMLTGNGILGGLPPFDREAWNKSWGRSKALVTSFIRARPTLLTENPDKIRGRFPMAFATPRSWDCAARLLATTIAFDESEAVFPLFKACVGEPAAQEFTTWLRTADLPDPESLLKNADLWTPDPKRPDLTFAVLTSVAACATEARPTAEEYGRRWVAAWSVLAKAMAQGKDIVVVAAKMLASKRPIGKNGLLKPEVQKVAMSLLGVIDAANAR